MLSGVQTEATTQTEEFSSDSGEATFVIQADKERWGRGVLD